MDRDERSRGELYARACSPQVEPRQVFKRFSGIAGKSSLVTGRGDARELTYYPLRQLLAFFFGGPSGGSVALSFSRSLPLPGFFLFTVISRLRTLTSRDSLHARQKAANLTLVPTARSSPARTHARTHAGDRTRAVVHAKRCDLRRSVRQTMGNPGRSPSVRRRLKSDRIGRRPDGDPR